ncbi:hypothetical protein F4779DRAFT_201555 [Xylariaceae sp. FL0662B]|nr:hypothetical protein F4779DRAFT_201555 [Xylariaceae sp. FL0662B]
MLQQALSGHGLRPEMLAVPPGGAVVPGFCGPHTALAIGAGIGGVPVLRQMTLPTNSRSQPLHAHVSWLKLSTSSTVRLWASAMPQQLSSATILYVAHDPSSLGFGLKSGSVPGEQHTCCFGMSVEHSVGLGLYSKNLLGEMPHLVANDAQLSPATTWIVLQSSRRSRLLPRIARGTVLVEEVALISLIVAFDASTNGVVKLAVLIISCVVLNVRHVALQHLESVITAFG